MVYLQICLVLLKNKRMKIFIFKPSNELAGKIEVMGEDGVGAAVKSFVESSSGIPNFSYVEAFGKTWTITCQQPFQLELGRLIKPSTVSPVVPVVQRTLAQEINDLLAFAFIIFYIGTKMLFAVAVLFLIYDCFTWLRTGAWDPSETKMLLEVAPDFAEWIRSPQSWIGLHSVCLIILKLPWAILTPLFPGICGFICMSKALKSGISVRA